MTQQQVLLNEIRQIVNQYKNEVPGKRTAWPNSVKQRTMDLHELGLSYKAIADETGISYCTILNWRNQSTQAGEFNELTTATVTVPPQKPGGLTKITSSSTTAITTITVITPSGFKIEGILFEQMLSILESLK